MERPFFDISADPDWIASDRAGGPGRSRQAEAPGCRLVRAAGLAVGTRVRTPSGPELVEALRPGDLVLTRDDGPLPLIWCSPAIDSPTLSLASSAPGIAREGRSTLGAVSVTPGLRVLIEDERAELLFGAGEVLGRAGDLALHHPLTRESGTIGPCVALLLACHALIEADGVWCESFLPEDAHLRELGALNARALRHCYPRIGHATGQAAYQTARPVLNRREVALLA